MLHYFQLKEIIVKYKDVEGMDVIGKTALELPTIYNQWFTNNKKDIDEILDTLTGSSVAFVPSIILMVISFFLLIEL